MSHIETVSKPSLDPVKVSLAYAEYCYGRAEWEVRMGNMRGERNYLEQEQAALAEAIGWASR